MVHASFCVCELGHHAPYHVGNSNSYIELCEEVDSWRKRNLILHYVHV